MSRHHHTAVNRRGWAAIRRRELRRAGRRCERCGRAGRLEVHHADVCLADGGKHTQRLDVVCRVCHLAEHHKPDPARDAWRAFMREQSAC